jgi:hypothetical protein
VSSDGSDGSDELTAGTPPSQDEALRVAEPLLDELGLAEDEVDASQTAGSMRIVTAKPEVGGLPVDGMATQVYVGPGGELVSAGGALGEPVAGEERAVTGAQEALDAFNETQGAEEMLRAPQCDAGDGPELKPAPVPEDDGGSGEAEQPCAVAEKPEPVEVTAEFGLALHYSGDEPLLVPSWIFHATMEDGTPYTVSHPAVPFEIGSQSADDNGGSPSGSGSGSGSGSDGSGGNGGSEPGNPGGEGDGAETGPGERGQADGPVGEDAGMSVETYDAEGRTLTLHFWGGVCDDYTATADESAEEITVRVEASNPDPERQCIMLAEKQTAEVTLSEPVGDRTVVDPRGEEIPVR